MAPAPPLSRSPRRAQRPGRETGAGAGAGRKRARRKSMPSACPMWEAPTVFHGCLRSAETAAHGSALPMSSSFPSSRSNTRAAGGPRLREGSRTGREGGGSPGRGYPVASTPRLSRSGVGARSARWVLQLDPYPRPAPRQARRRDGIPASAPVLRQGNISRGL
jgi:hypothetical protein